jgi:hypothetical protein
MLYTGGFSPYYLPKADMSFSTLGLAPSLLNAVTEIGYQEPTAIQRAAIPAILRGEDVLGAAQTGSGKTAALRCRCCNRCWTSAAATPAAWPGAGADARAGGAGGDSIASWRRI